MNCPKCGFWSAPTQIKKVGMCRICQRKEKGKHELQKVRV